MALTWQPVDLRSDPDEAEHRGDPGEVIDAAAFVAELIHRRVWHARAACRGQGVAAWFPNRGESTGPAMSICDACLVHDECRDYAVAGGMYIAGIWGGTSDRERKRLRRAGQRRAA